MRPLGEEGLAAAHAGALGGALAAMRMGRFFAVGIPQPIADLAKGQASEVADFAVGGAGGAQAVDVVADGGHT